MRLLKKINILFFLMTLSSCTIYEYNTLYSKLAPSEDDIQHFIDQNKEKSKDELVVVNDKK